MQSRRSVSTASAQRLRSPTKASGSFSDLFLILQQHGIEHLANHIADCGFGVSEIGNIFKTEADVSRLLRVTNKADKARLVGLAAWIRQVDDRYIEKHHDAPEATTGAEGDTATAGSTFSRTPSTAAAVAQQTFMYKVPTTATANEYCRQAATFLDHYRVDRAWPKRRSVLSKTLGLPTAEDPIAIRQRTAEHIATHKLYTTGGSQNNEAEKGLSRANKSETSNIERTTSNNQNSDNDEIAFKVYQRPARHFSVPMDGARKAKHDKEVAAREEALKSGKYGGSWHEVGQKHPDKGGPLDPFPTATGPSLSSLHAMHSGDRPGTCSSSHNHSTKDLSGNLYETHIVHQHGCQARQCPVCRHHATERSGDGNWQYLAMVKLPPSFDGSAVAVDLKALLKRRRKNNNSNTIDPDTISETQGVIKKEEDEEDLVPMWVPFAGPENIILETAYRKKAISILVRGKLANLNRMRWNKRPLRRSHVGDVPFPIEHGLRALGDESDDEDEDADEILRRATDAERLADALRQSFLGLLAAEEERSRATIEAEADTGLRGLKADLNRGSRQIYANLLENVVREEEIARRAIRSQSSIDFENNILAPLAEQWRQEEIRRLARQEILAAQQILASQRKLVENHEAEGRSAIEEEEAEEWRALERALRQLHAQIALFHQQLHADRNSANQCSQGFDDGTRCAKCLDPNCPFHRKPWASHWRRVGGALDLKPYSLAIDTLDGLVATALDRQYEELGGAGTTATDVMNAATDDAAKSAKKSRARGLRGMRYHSTQHDAGDDAALLVDRNGNILDLKMPKRPASAGLSRKVPLGVSVATSTASQVQPTPSAAAFQTSQSLSRPQSAGPQGRNKSSHQNNKVNPSPPPPAPPSVSSSNYNYPDQVPIRLRRLQENLNKPAPFHHGRAVLDMNDVYRAGEESERSPKARKVLKENTAAKAKILQEEASASVLGSTVEKANPWSNVEDDEDRFPVHKPRKAQASPSPIARRKNANPTTAFDAENSQNNINASESSTGLRHTAPFAGGGSKSYHKVHNKSGAEYAPTVMSHYELMRRKNARKPASALPHLQNM